MKLKKLEKWVIRKFTVSQFTCKERSHLLHHHRLRSLNEPAFFTLSTMGAANTTSVTYIDTGRRDVAGHTWIFDTMHNHLYIGACEPTDRSRCGLTMLSGRASLPAG